MRNLSAFLFVAALGGSAAANGFVVNEHDAMATGRGTAVAATNDTPSSIVYNPGGVAVGEGTAILIGGSVISATGKYTPEGSTTTTETDSPASVLPQLYLTSRVHDMVAVGIGLHTPFGSAISWPTDAPTSDVITEQKLRTYFISPVIGINLDKQVPGLSIGGGLDLVPATVELKRNVFFGDTQGTVHLGGEAFGIGGRAGVMYRPPAVKQLSVGVMWRSAVKLDFEGTGDFDIDEPFRGQLPPDGPISTSIELPQSVLGGVAVRPVENLELEMNVVWMQWSTFQELKINLPTRDPNMPAETVAVQRYEDRVSFRFGAQYTLPEQGLKLRAGFVFDPTPIPDDTVTAQLPDADRRNIALGAGYTIQKNYDINLGLLWVTPNERRTSDKMYEPVHKGEYGITAFVAALSFVGRFGVN
ncbi:MAG: outer membrane protein transport protein [Deltaproteobacteria bacterium]|nr:outer membrane protein transport protein [Deltaproteobacteria bacterium]